jgi:hypothetical protein
MASFELFSVAVVASWAWFKVAELRYGNARQLDAVTSRLSQIEAQLAKVNLADLARLQDEIAGLKVKGIWK